jgi:hypothetical protein
MRAAVAAPSAGAAGAEEDGGAGVRRMTVVVGRLVRGPVERFLQVIF